MKNYLEVENLKNDANKAKYDLMDIAQKLYNVKAIREAKSLETIIEKLEIWQNK